MLKRATEDGSRRGRSDDDELERDSNSESRRNTHTDTRERKKLAKPLWNAGVCVFVFVQFDIRVNVCASQLCLCVQCMWIESDKWTNDDEMKKKSFQIKHTHTHIRARVRVSVCVCWCWTWARVILEMWQRCLIASARSLKPFIDGPLSQFRTNEFRLSDLIFFKEQDDDTMHFPLFPNEEKQNKTEEFDFRISFTKIESEGRQRITAPTNTHTYTRCCVVIQSFNVRLYNSTPFLRVRLC